MYAIIQDGGHQYRVEPGKLLQIQLRPSAAGETITFEKVCLVGETGNAPRIGAPFLDGARVEAKVTKPEVKGKKLVVSFYRRRKHSRKRNGHRQQFTEVEITGISG